MYERLTEQINSVGKTNHSLDCYCSFVCQLLTVMHISTCSMCALVCVCNGVTFPCKSEIDFGGPKNGLVWNRTDQYTHTHRHAQKETNNMQEHKDDHSLRSLPENACMVEQREQMSRQTGMQTDNQTNRGMGMITSTLLIRYSLEACSSQPKI